MGILYLLCTILAWMLPIIRSDAVTTDQNHHSTYQRTGGTTGVAESINYNSKPSENMHLPPNPTVSKDQGLLRTGNAGKTSNNYSSTIWGITNDKTTGMPMGKISTLTSMASVDNYPSLIEKGLSPTEATTNQSSPEMSILDNQTGTVPTIHVVSHSEAETNVHFGMTELPSTFGPTKPDIHQQTPSLADSQTIAPKNVSALQPSINNSPTTEHASTVHPTSATPITTQNSSKKAFNNDTSGVTASEKVTGTTRRRGYSSPKVIRMKTATTVTTIKRFVNPDNTPSRDRTEISSILVALLIGGALVLMLASFAVISLRMRRQHSRKLETTDWAGPSPFLDGVDNSSARVEMRASNRISLSGFLPQRLSMRISMLKEVDEAKDLTAGVTFGREIDDVATTENGTALMDERKRNKQEFALETVGVAETKPPPPTTDPQSVVVTSQISSDNPPLPPAPADFIRIELDPPLGQASHSFPPKAADTVPPSWLDDNLGQPLEQTPTSHTVPDARGNLPPPQQDGNLDLNLENLSTSTADIIIPPAPPLKGFTQKN